MAKPVVSLPLPAPSPRAVEDTYYRAQRRQDKGAFLSIAFLVPGLLIAYVANALAQAHGGSHTLWLGTGYTLGGLGVLTFLLTCRSTMPFLSVSDKTQQEVEALCAKSEQGRTYLDSVRTQGRTRFVRCEAAEIKKVLARK